MVVAHARPRATSSANLPKWRRTPWRIGSSASKRVARACGMDADTFGRAMIHRNEHRGVAFTGEGGGQIGSPHGVHCLGNDRAVMRCAVRARTPTGWAPADRFPASAGARAVTMCGFRRGAAGPKPCDGPRHETDWRRARRGSPQVSAASGIAPVGPRRPAVSRAAVSGGDRRQSGQPARPGRRWPDP